MKKSFLFAAVSLMLAGCAGHGTVINGEVENLADGYVYLADMKQQGAVIDSALVSGGKFRFALDDAQPTFARIATAHVPVAYIYIEKGEITVSGNMTDSSVTVGGTTANDGFAEYVKEMGILREDFRNAETQEMANEIDAKYEALVAKTIEQNKDNIFGIDLYIGTNGYDMSAAEMIKYLKALPETLRAIPLVADALAQAEQRIKTEPQAEGSDYVPHYIDIVQPDTDGKEISLASVVENPKNRYVLIDFWASWCGPCMREIPELVEAYKKYHKKGLEIYGISLDREADAWKNALDNNKMTWINVSSLTSFDNKAVEDYAVQAIPTNYLVDCSNGVIIAKNLRGEEVAKKFAELFE